MSENSLSASSLNAMRVAQVKELAGQMGINLGPKARKADYVAAIRAKQAEAQGKGERAESAAAAVAEVPAHTREKVELDPEQKQAALDALGDAAQRRAENNQNRGKEANRRSRLRGRRDDRSKGGDDEAQEQAPQARDDSEQDSSQDRENRGGQEGRGNQNENEGGNGRQVRDRRRQNREARQKNSQRRGESDSSNNNGSNNSSQQSGNSSNEDVLLPVAGILDIAGTNAYLRTAGYLPGNSDAYVSTQMIKKFGLRRGDAIVGAVRSLADSPARRGQRQHKYNPLVEINSVNGLSPEESLQRPEFNKLTPLYPQEMLRMETTHNALTTRVIDLVAPIGKGQRGLIVSPPKAGKTVIMQQLAMAIAKNNPEVHLMVVLVDERPEEVTDMRRLVKGEVIASTFDRPASDHTIVSELAVERAKRLVELGQDVVILLDSITRLGRAYNLAQPASGRILSGGVDAAALYPPKKFFGAARNIENGGSLTIIASALVETGSKMDEVIFEEFKGTGNMELRLSRQLADRRIFPAVDVNASGTRREELLFSPEELKIVWHLRRALGTLEVQEASDYLLGRLRKTESNKDFLVSVVRGMQAAE